MRESNGCVGEMERHLCKPCQYTTSGSFFNNQAFSTRLSFSWPMDELSRGWYCKHRGISVALGQENVLVAAMVHPYQAQSTNSVIRADCHAAKTGMPYLAIGRVRPILLQN